MHYNFVDIGTCDFDLSVNPLNNTDTALLVEPLKYYLDKIPDHPLIVKSNVAISNISSTGKIYFLPEEVIIENKLKEYLKGCSSLNSYHPLILDQLKEFKLDTNLIRSEIVNVITFEDLCNQYNITSIGNLKIDTEGHEQYILPDVLKEIKKGMVIKSIQFENQEYLGNKEFLDNLIPNFQSIGYLIKEITSQDVVLTLP